MTSATMRTVRTTSARRVRVKLAWHSIQKAAREEAARGRERDNKLDLSRRIKAMEEKERASREKSERRAQIERTAMEESDRRGREKLAALRAKERAQAALCANDDKKELERLRLQASLPKQACCVVS